MKVKYRNKERLVDFSFNTILVLVAIVTIYPLWYVLIASVSSPVAIANGEVLVWPVDFTLAGYREAFGERRIWIGYRNSIIYTCSALVVDMIVQILCAYALSIKNLPGKRFFNILILIPMYFSGGLIPTYLLLSSLGFINSPLALILPASVVTYNIIVAKSFFANSVPDSLFDAARIDGCSYTNFFIRIVLPLSKAILAIIALYNVQSHWNGYLGPAMYLYSPELHTLQQVLRSISANLDSSLSDTTLTIKEQIEIMQRQQLLKYAVIVVSCLPLAIMYPFVQKFFVKGVMVGAVKG